MTYARGVGQREGGERPTEKKSLRESGLTWVAALHGERWGERERQRGAERGRERQRGAERGRERQ